jgi:DMSO/TMAO reductase YedYZ molybdopterin-dependent catalytic subunit
MENQTDNINKIIKRRTISSFIFLGIAIIAAYSFWNWLNNQPKEDRTSSPLRAALKFNERVFSKVIYSNSNIAPAFTKSEAARKVRFNGGEGLRSTLDSEGWRLKIVRSKNDTLYLTLDELKSFPKTEIIFDFKCVEGWNQVTHWGGVRFADVAKKYNLGSTDSKVPDYINYSNLFPFVGLYTPDSGYYVGMDMPSMLHPQTLLCYEMNGKPLPISQGYPLRLITPVKYGVKNIKRIGTIYFSNDPPPDYWAERGYDYYLGL